MQGSGYVEPHYLARRSNGQLIKLTQLLYLVADAAAEGSRGLEQIAEQVSERFGRTVSADNVATLVAKLRPLGVLTAADGSSPAAPATDPLLGLKLRTSLIPASAIARVVSVFRPLFWPVVIAVVGVALLAFDVWLFFVHGVADSLRSSTEQPLVFLLVAALVVISAAFHELGHAAACAYGGGKPGRMGAGVYVAWPAFYTDVTDAYRLSRAGRLRTDLGGVYFNALIVCGLAAVFWSTGYEPLLLACFILQVQIVQQLLPLLRLDGYYVLSDAVGVPDLFGRIGPILRSAVPFRKPAPEVLELKGRVRVAVTAWVLLVVPLLLANLIYIISQAPRLAASSWDSAARLWGQLTSSPGTAAMLMAGIQLVFLVIPVLGIIYTFTRLIARGGRAAWRWSSGSGLRRLGVILGAGLLAAALAAAWWPDGRWAPYREGEPGTLQQGVSDLAAVGDGTPLLRSPAEAQQPLPPVEEGTSGINGRSAAPGTPVSDPAPRPSPEASDPAPGGGSPSGDGPASAEPTDPATDNSGGSQDTDQTGADGSSGTPSPASSPLGSTTPSSTTEPTSGASSEPTSGASSEPTSGATSGPSSPAASPESSTNSASQSASAFETSQENP